MIKLNPIQSRILKTLLQSRYYLTTAQVAYHANISWNTAFYYLKDFYSRGWVYKKTAGKVNYWKAIRRYY